MEKLGLIDHLMYMADRHELATLVMSGAMVLGPSREDEALNADDIAEHLAARLQKIPKLRKRFMQDPLHLGSVKKVDDPHFYVWDHVDVVQLPSPGSYEQLRSAIADYANQPFGLKDVFEFMVIGGLEGGQVALASKIHHAFVDGMGAAEIMKSVFDEQPVTLERVRGRRGHKSASVPSALNLTRNAIGENLDLLFRKVPRAVYKSAPYLYSSLASRLGEKSSAEESVPQQSRPQCRPTSLNHMPTEESFRTLSYQVLDLGELKSLSRKFNCTVNDLALVLFSCALERYFESTGEEIDFDLIVAMPISLRGSGTASGGNQLTGAFINVHNTEHDLLERLKKVNAETRMAKSERRPDKPDNTLDLQELADLIAAPIIDLAIYVAGKARLMDRLESKLAFLNAFFTNVPGYAVTTYLGNARLEYGIPMIPAVPMLAVSPGATSSGDSIVFGFNCDGSVIEDANVFVEGLEHGLQALRTSARANTNTGREKSTGSSRRKTAGRSNRTTGNKRRMKPST